MSSKQICLQCHKELQENPSARARKQGKKAYEVRDRIISPIEIRCMRCHRRLSRNDRCFDSTLRPVQLALGLVFVGCESIYGGVKGAVNGLRGSTRGNGGQESQEPHGHKQDDTTPFEPPPNYEEATTHKQA